MSTYQMMAPDHVLVEACNALRRTAQAGLISQDQATSEFHNLMLLDLELCSFKPLAQRIWEPRGNLTSHDAWYVALAEQLHCPLLTLDMRLGRAPGPLCDIITPQSGLPEAMVHQSVSRAASVVEGNGFESVPAGALTCGTGQDAGARAGASGAESATRLQCGSCTRRHAGGREELPDAVSPADRAGSSGEPARPRVGIARVSPQGICARSTTGRVRPSDHCPFLIDKRRRLAGKGRTETTYNPHRSAMFSVQSSVAPHIECLPLEQRLGLDALLQRFVRRQDRCVDLPLVQ